MAIASNVKVVSNYFTYFVPVLQISIQSYWANREITMEIRTSNVPCPDLSVVWRTTWEESNHGMQKSPLADLEGGPSTGLGVPLTENVNKRYAIYCMSIAKLFTIYEIQIGVL